MSAWAQDPRILALGWALVHSLWQDLVLGLAAAGVLAFLRSPRARYGVAGLALGACLAVPALSLAFIWPSGSSSLHVPSGLLEAGSAWAPSASALPRPAPLSWVGRLAPGLSWIAGAWALGVLLVGARFTGAWIWMRRRAATAAGAVPPALEAALAALAPRLGIRRPVSLRASAREEGPVTFGWWRPVVLVPASLLAGMNPALLEALLAHELAHVARGDYLVNLAQCLVEVLCFHHPAVWWLSREVREARELLCDARAARALGDPARLARALDALDDHQARPHALALPAHGGHLLMRIRHLLSPVRPRAPRPLALACLVLIVPLLLAAMRLGPGPLPAGSPAVTGRLVQDKGGAWFIEGEANHKGPLGRLTLYVDLPGGPFLSFGVGKDVPKDFQPGWVTRVSWGTEARIPDGKRGLRITLREDATGAIGTATVPPGQTDFRFALAPQDLARDPAWMQGEVVRDPAGEGSATFRCTAFLAGTDLSILSPEGKVLGRMMASGPGAGEAVSRDFLRPKIRFPLGPDQDRLVIRLREPATGREGTASLDLKGGAAVFRIDLEPKG